MSVQHDAARQKAVEWARTVLALNPVIIDFETTGVRDSEIVQIGALDARGAIVMSTLVRPVNRIPAEVIAIHGITNERVADAPRFTDLYTALSVALAGRVAIAYNAPFDRGVLEGVCRRHGLPVPRLLRWECAMRAYAGYWGSLHPQRRYFAWQKLTAACQQQSITVADAHNALGDCHMTLALIQRMAQG
jgi:DNA polymerase III epsilon subunit-like protein